MKNSLRRRLVAAGALVVLLLAVVPGMAYAGPWAGPEGEIDVIVSESGGHNHGHDHADGHFHGSGMQECRVGPSKCTGQPSFVATTWLGDAAWTILPPPGVMALPGPLPAAAGQAPVYRMKPPPRAAWL